MEQALLPPHHNNGQKLHRPPRAVISQTRARSMSREKPTARNAERPLRTRRGLPNAAGKVQSPKRQALQSAVRMINLLSVEDGVGSRPDGFMECN